MPSRTVQERDDARERRLAETAADLEEPVPTVMTSTAPPMLYDDHGFPPEAFRIDWPAPGDPRLASCVRCLLEGAGLSTAEDPRRGYDHGTFVPSKVHRRRAPRAPAIRSR
jgi:hypothetical protein